MLNRCPICAPIKITAFVPKKRGVTKQESGEGEKEGGREADEENVSVGGGCKGSMQERKTRQE